MDNLPLSDLGPTTNNNSNNDDDTNPTSSSATTTAASAASAAASDYQCPHSDSEVVHKLAQLLLPGLSAAAVDSTTGDLFRSPATVAVDLRHHLLLHLSSRSLTLVPESLSLLDSPDPHPDLPDLDDPVDLLSFLLEEFASSRRNLLGKVSGWILTESREDKIDDFVQEMEMSGFWKIDRREAIADELLKNLDYKKRYHCAMRFDDPDELERHMKVCSFRPVTCRNDGCKVKYCKVHEEKHEEVCGYKVLECEQKCGERIVRREMDRHCITVCKMRMVNCPFYQVGCQSAFPQCLLGEHCREFLKGHLACVMGMRNEEGLGGDVLKERAERLDKSEFHDELAAALNLRQLTSAIKNVEAKIKKQQELEKHNLQSEQQVADQA